MIPQEINNRIDALQAELDLLKAEHTIPFDVEMAFKNRLNIELPEGMENAPLTAITAPTGGATTDSQARTAINDIITALESLGLVIPN